MVRPRELPCFISAVRKWKREREREIERRQGGGRTLTPCKSTRGGASCSEASQCSPWDRSGRANGRRARRRKEAHAPTRGPRWRHCPAPAHSSSQPRSRSRTERAEATLGSRYQAVLRACVCVRACRGTCVAARRRHARQRIRGDKEMERKACVRRRTTTDDDAIARTHHHGSCSPSSGGKASRQQGRRKEARTHDAACANAASERHAQRNAPGITRLRGERLDKLVTVPQTNHCSSPSLPPLSLPSSPLKKEAPGMLCAAADFFVGGEGT